MPIPPTLEWLPGGVLRLLDQRRIPLEVRFVETNDYREAAALIRAMAVRGAPAIGATAAYAMALAAHQAAASDPAGLLAALEQAAQTLKEARPTAVNLAWAVERQLATPRAGPFTGAAGLQAALLAEAEAIAAEDVRANRAMGQHAAEAAAAAGPPDDLHPSLQYRFAGDGRVRHGAGGDPRRPRSGRRVFVYVDETRPALQGRA